MITNSIPALIVDDEASSRENVSMLLQQFCPTLTVAGVADNAATAERMIRKHRPRLIFLDIQLGTEDAFALLKRLDGVDFEVIFITAHDHYALRAFEFMAVDYLLKPIEIPQLVRAVNNAAARIGNRSLNLSLEQMMMQVEDFNRNQHKLALATGRGYEMVYIREIMYCLAEGSYTHFYFRGGEEMVVSKNLKYYENLLEDYAFARSHNTVLVHLRYVRSIERINGGALVMEDGKMLPVSKPKRRELEARIRDKRRLV